MSILRIDAKSPTALTDALAARDARRDFDLVMAGSGAKRLQATVRRYEAYRDALKYRRSNRIGPFLSFGIRGIWSPFFWGICILMESHTRSIDFVTGEKSIEVQFRF